MPRVVVAFASLVACTGADEGVDAVDSVDPCAEEARTWQSWGAGFFANYCRSCHSVDAPYRYSAPEGVDFDTLEQVRQWEASIRTLVLEERTMPVGGGVPEADLLGLEAFLACGL